MKILLIEDNISILESLEYSLTKNGLKVEKSTTIKEAKEKINTKEILFFSFLIRILFILARSIDIENGFVI